MMDAMIAVGWILLVASLILVFVWLLWVIWKNASLIIATIAALVFWYIGLRIGLTDYPTIGSSVSAAGIILFGMSIMGFGLKFNFRSN
jgi:hypothetical protein